MECVGCQGLMVAECFSDMEETSGRAWLFFWRCVNCGEIIDSVINDYRKRDKSTQGRLPQVCRPMVRSRYPVGIRVRGNEHNPRLEAEYLIVKTRDFGYSVQKRSGEHRQG